MIYPEFLHKGDTIGICAPSAGVGKKLDSFDLAVNYLKQRGYNIKETASVRVNDQRSADAPVRAAELDELVQDPETNMIMCAAGGDFLDEILPYVNFRSLKAHPKWIMGASDPTGLLFPITTKYDIATIYGLNAGSYDLDPVPEFITKNLQILSGRHTVQKSSSLHMKTPSFLAEKIEFDTPTAWIANTDSLDIQGRCIGGCIDVLKDLIGTPYDGARQFVRRYQDDGIIWYFDNFSLSAEVFYRTLLQMKYAGWFKGTKAILIGRHLFESSETGMTYDEAVQRAIGEYTVIQEADIGHTLPHMTMINGAIMHLKYRNQKASLFFETES